MNQQTKTFSVEELNATIYEVLKSELIAKVYLENGVIKIQSLADEVFLLNVQKA